jgi:hypothetical protein
MKVIITIAIIIIFKMPHFLHLPQKLVLLYFTHPQRLHVSYLILYLQEFLATRLYPLFLQDLYSNVESLKIKNQIMGLLTSFLSNSIKKYLQYFIYLSRFILHFL